MTVFALRRLFQSVILVVVTSIIVFFGVNVIGDPVAVLAGPQCYGECRREVARQLGLDLPIYDQYFAFVKNALSGDLGDSFAYGEPAVVMILERLPATLELAGSAILLAVVLGIPLGLWAGLRPQAASARIIMGGSILGFSTPVFWQAIIMIMLFSVQLGWLPATGRGETIDVMGIPLSIFTWDGLTHLALPVINLSLIPMALVVRLCRAGTQEVLHQDYIKFARAKGLTSRRIVSVHILKNILIPVVTVLGIELGTVIGFAVVTETVYAWPGIGKLAIDAIEVLDRPIILSYILFTVLMFIVINLLVDLLCSVLDPRLRLQEAAT